MAFVNLTFVGFSLELSLYSLSHTLAHLEHSWSTLALGKGRQGKGKKEKGKKISSK